MTNNEKLLIDALERVLRTDAVENDDKNRGEGTVYDDARAAIATVRGTE